MPSLSEGLPVAGVQALAAGWPLSPAISAAFWTWWIDEKNGYLIDAHDIPAFSSALRGLISHPETLLRFREASVEKSRQFDIQKIVNQYQSILYDVLNGK